MNKSKGLSILSAVLCFSVLLFTGCSRKNQTAETKLPATRTVTDHDGDIVEIPSEINHVVIISIWPLPSVTTIFLGGTEKIAGIPPASIGAAKVSVLSEMYPDFLNIPESCNSSGELNVEEILKLNPDVVFCSAREPETKALLKSAGVPVVAFSVNKWNYNILETYDNWIELLGQVFPEYKKEDKVSEFSRKAYEEIQAKVKDIPSDQRKKVLFLFQYNEKNIITSGKKFFGQYWCDAVGAKNVAEEVGAENANAVVSMEQIYAWNPDVILITNFTAALPETLYENKTPGYDWSVVKAVQEKQVYKMPLGTYRSYTPSADTPATLLWIAQKVYPELFGDMDLTERVKNYFKDLYGIELTDSQIHRMYNQNEAGAVGVKIY